MFGFSGATNGGTKMVDSDDDQNVIKMPVGDSLDLHAFTPKDIPDVVDSYLQAAVEKGWSEVRLIHGKGTGFQRERVRKLLEIHPLVSGYADAPAERGHWGATIVRLRQPGARE
jgi:DNA-nicking Smr family endonuclease